MNRLIVLAFGAIFGTIVTFVGAHQLRSRMPLETFEKLDSSETEQAHPYVEKFLKVKLQEEADSKHSLEAVTKRLSENEVAVEIQDRLLH